MNSIRFIVFISWLFCFVDFSRSQVFTISEEENVVSFINATVKCKNSTGMSVAVSHNDEVFTAGFGFADIDKGIQVTSSTKMNIGSVTKTLTSFLLARMISEAKKRNISNIDWNTKIKDVLGEDFEINDKCLSSHVTLEDFVSHRTGLNSADLFLQAGVPHHITRQDILQNFNSLDSVVPFRDIWSYCNICWVIIGRFSELLGKDTWENLMRDKVFLPLNMSSTTFLNENTIDELATPYTTSKENGTVKSDKRLYTIVEQFGPAGSVCSTADDMSKLLRYLTSHDYQSDLNIQDDVFKSLFQRKSMLPGKSAERSSLRSPPFPASFDVYGYGMGWFLARYRGLDLYYHTGGLYGYTSLLAFVPSKNFSMFVNSNGDTRVSTTMMPILFYVYDTLFENEAWLNESTVCTYPSPWKHEPDSEESNQTLSHNDIDKKERFVGVFRDPLRGNLSVFLVNDTLNFSYGRLFKGTLSFYKEFVFNMTFIEPMSEIFPHSQFITTYDRESVRDDKFTRAKINGDPYFERNANNQINSANMSRLESYILVILVAFIKTVLF